MYADVGRRLAELITQIRQRRTHRDAFDPEPVPPDLLQALSEGATRDGATLHIVSDSGQRAALAAAVETAERTMHLDSARVQELITWTPPPGSPRRDGVPSTSYPVRPQHTNPDFPARDFAHGRGWGMPPPSWASVAPTAGTVGLITTPGDAPVDWVNAGQALQRMLLSAGSYGVAAAMHSQPA